LLSASGFRLERKLVGEVEVGDILGEDEGKGFEKYSNYLK
jgi:hypothetical protein